MSGQKILFVCVILLLINFVSSSLALETSTSPTSSGTSKTILNSKKLSVKNVSIDNLIQSLIPKTIVIDYFNSRMKNAKKFYIKLDL